MNAEIITPAESVRLCELERIIQKGKDTFVEVGTALSEIRDSRIYRATFKTFEDYCKDRWDFTREHASKLIQAAVVVGNLSPIGDKPKTESQARPLTKLPAEKQPAAWERAQEIAKEESKPVAARHVEAAVLEVMPKEEPETVVVDGVSKETPKRRTPNYIPSDALDIWNVAKTHLDRILKNDIHREQALNEVIAYCQNRISNKK